MDLFEAETKAKIAEGPLAARMRPRNLDEYIGQDHIVGKGRLLRRAIAADQLTSVIFYGPPGTGKTTLARVIANSTKSNFITLNAVLTGVQNIRDAITRAEDYRKLYGRKTILFVDEVHRWNKSQQDALLPWVENGTFILVGATTENPFFEVNKALVSRSRVFQLKPLTADDLKKAALNALNDKERGYGRWKVVFEEGALEHLIETANGDARSLLNALELAVETTPEKWEPEATPCFPPEGSQIYISKETAEESIQKKVVLYDRDGDYHYDIISAFIKSLRGRDPDAAMYWMARMIAAGEDPHFIFRRMLISACEDTGLADPYAIAVVTACADAFDRVGLPEGRYHLAHAALYLATAPKSNSSMAFFDALSSVEKEDAEVPNHLRDSSRDAEGFGHGAGYMYPHAYRDHWVAQQYLPDGLAGRVFYTPTDQGYEKSIKADVLSRREMQIAAMLEAENSTSIFESYEPSGFGFVPEACSENPESRFTRSPTAKSCASSKSENTSPNTAYATGSSDTNVSTANAKHNTSPIPVAAKTEENLTFSPGGKQRDAFQKRLDTNRAEVLLELRNAAIDAADLKRHSRVLVYNCDDGLFLWETWRRCPEGITCGICKTQKGMQTLEQYGRTLSELEKPVFVMSEEELQQKTGGVTFDSVLFRDPCTTKESIKNFVQKITTQDFQTLCSSNFTCVVTQKIPQLTQRLSSLLLKTRTATPKERELLEKMLQAEEKFYTGKTGNKTTDDYFSWSLNDFSQALASKGFNVKTAELPLTENKFINTDEIEKWFDTEHSSYAKFISNEVGSENFKALYELFLKLCAKHTVKWNSTIAVVVF